MLTSLGISLGGKEGSGGRSVSTIVMPGRPQKGEKNFQKSELWGIFVLRYLYFSEVCRYLSHSCQLYEQWGNHITAWYQRGASSVR
jgi:hypothetical protein